MKLDTTPKQDGFYFPAEYAPIREVWLAWPERQDNWRLQAKPAQEAFANVANAIAEVVHVSVAVSLSQLKTARTMLDSSVKLVEMSLNDSWMRDIGPTVVVNKSRDKRGISWIFNAWGGKFNGLYKDWADDDNVAASVCYVLGIDYYRAPFVLEGGAIHTDGEGTLFTTEECLLSLGRNPKLSKKKIESLLTEYLGIEKIIWLPNGMFKDETDGHIDNLLHVIAPAKVVLSWTDDPFDPQFKLSHAAFNVLSTQADAKSRKIEIIKMPVPGPLYYSQEEAKGIESSMGMSRQEGERLCASYTNFLMVNGHIFFPLLDKRYDHIAVEILEGALPNYKIVGIPTREVLLGGGNIHCITQQIPL